MADKFGITGIYVTDTILLGTSKVTYSVVLRSLTTSNIRRVVNNGKLKAIKGHLLDAATTGSYIPAPVTAVNFQHED